MVITNKRNLTPEIKVKKTEANDSIPLFDFPIYVIKNKETKMHRFFSKQANSCILHLMFLPIR